jgi:hypothetical protein
VIAWLLEDLDERTAVLANARLASYILAARREV